MGIFLNFKAGVYQQEALEMSISHKTQNFQVIRTKVASHFHASRIFGQLKLLSALKGLKRVLNDLLDRRLSDYVISFYKCFKIKYKVPTKNLH